MSFQPLESAFAQVVLKYRPQIEALELEMVSDAGLMVLPTAPIAEDRKQSLLFGSFFSGLNKPLSLPVVQKQVESPRAFVVRHKIQNGTFITDSMVQPVTKNQFKAVRAFSFQSRFGIVRIGFIRRHCSSIKRRWLANDRTRLGLFPGSPVFYLLGL